ncbi:MAG: hypothetical protein LM580_01425 [Thermofilum sp.]|nr:hypothetical protein [Thermofilum sp.]MCC6064862.1 hypothetical protein [Thermofilum sp.]
MRAWAAGGISRKLSGPLMLASETAAGASLLLSAWYAICTARVALPDPGATAPYLPVYVGAEQALMAGLVWAALLALALAPVLGYASPLALFLAAAPPWLLALASLATAVVHGRRIVWGLVSALACLEALALAEQVAALLGLRPYGLFAHVERGLRLAASVAALPLLVAMLLLGPFKYLERLLKGEEGGGGSGFELRYLLPAALLAVAVSQAPYLPSVNPSGRMVGVDPASYYPVWLRELRVNFALSHPALRTRPAFVLLLYGLSLALGDYWALRVAQALTFAAFATGTYFFALWLLGKRCSRLAALISPFSYTATVLLHSGYYNNILASSLSLPALALLDRWSKEGGRGRLAAALALYELAVLTHPYSTLFYSIALAGAAVAKLSKRGVALLAVAAVFALQAELQSMGFAESSAAQTVEHYALPLSREWAEGLAFVVYNCAVNAAVDAATWLLALLGLAESGSGLLASIAAASSAVALTAPVSNWSLRWRAIYALPLPAYQALALRDAPLTYKALALLALANYTLGFISNIA